MWLSIAMGPWMAEHSCWLGEKRREKWCLVLVKKKRRGTTYTNGETPLSSQESTQNYSPWWPSSTWCRKCRGKNLGTTELAWGRTCLRGERACPGAPCPCFWSRTESLIWNLKTQEIRSWWTRADRNNSRQYSIKVGIKSKLTIFSLLNIIL